MNKSSVLFALSLLQKIMFKQVEVKFKEKLTVISHNFQQ